MQEGILDLQVAGSLGAATSPCVVEAGALLLLSNNVSFAIAQPLVLRGTLRSAVPVPAPATLPVMTCSGPVSLEGAAPALQCEAPLILPGLVSGTAPLTKTGPERLRLSGPASNTFSGGITVEEGELELAKTPGARALPGPVFFGFGSQPATIRQLSSEQFLSTAQLAIGPKGMLHINGLDCGITSLELTGGTVTGAPGQLRLASGIAVLASEQTALLNSRIFCASSTAVWQVEDGAAVPDFKVTGTVENAGANPAVRKAGSGSLEITGSQLVQRFLVSAGELQWDASGPTRVQCDGGTITGSGSCSVLDGLAGGGTFSPGGSGIAADFHSTGAGFHPSTSCHFDILNAASHDQLFCAGPVVLNSAPLDLNAAQAFTAAPGTVLTLVHCTATTPVNGTFAYLPEGIHFVAGGRVFRISYQGGDGNDITLTAADGTAAVNGFTVTPGSGSSSGSTSIAISATGAWGLDYTLESSTDLQTWTPLTDASAGAGGTMQFTLLEPAATARKFYRLRTAGAP